MTEATAIILAGGKSNRMGTNKALLKIDRKTVIERIVDELKPSVTSMLIVTNSFEAYEFLQLPLIEDSWKDKGPLAGIHAGLTASATEKNLIVACDMPFVSAKLADILLKSLETGQAAVPIVDGQRHPLFAAYHKSAVSEAAALLTTGNLAIKNLLGHINTIYLDESELNQAGLYLEDYHLFNMNHPMDYKSAVKFQKKRAEN